jgi:hypothetical protein
MLGGFAPLPIRLGGTAQNGLTAAQHARICADMVAMARTMPLARIGLTTGQTGVRHYQAQPITGVANAPDISIGAPGAGWVRVTWPEGYTDPFGEGEPWRISAAEVGVLQYSTPVRAHYVIDAPNVVTVYTVAHPVSFPVDDIPVFLVVS